MSGARLPVELRRRVAETSRYRCGYCMTSQRVVGPLLEVDHIIPVAHGGTDDEHNLVLACPMCNGHKADRVEAVDPDGRVSVPLFNPNRQRWHEHFEWADGDTVIRGRTPTGRATVSALVMNHPDIVTARALWVAAGWHPPNDDRG